MTPLEQLAEAGDTILRFCAGRTFDEYAANDMLRAAVERELTILSRALIDAGTLAEHRAIADFHDVLVHGGPMVYDEAVWLIVQKETPRLLDRVPRLPPGPPPA